MRRLALGLVVIAGCTQYAHRSVHDAPGVVDLTTPMSNERGAPDLYVPPTDPGTETSSVTLMPTLGIGWGRRDVPKATGEAGLEVRFEHHTEAGRGYVGRSAWAITAGVGLAQFAENRPTIAGAFYGELSYRFAPLKGVIPTDLGIGPAFYGADPELGGQITLRILPLLFARARYLPRSGGEFWIGYEVPIPFLFQRSR